jgi:Lipase (class 3)
MIFTPSNYGFSDFYYDAILIRVPYRAGTIWKWYAYWATIILKTPSCFSWPRAVAEDWISRPRPELVGNEDAGLVHLGFWSLWASPEGFAGYDREGQLPEGANARILHHLTKALEDASGRDTEVLVVGHSLGGAVSWYDTHNSGGEGGVHFN